ncbi:NmrA family transcriptional regulator [Nocardiopsis gilva YIM 90087]|uniref:NmrA family transcriptional regulator n=1 Tax=Nocardiopsis gilva YIM 90087 TaxID=1235441 RepID=A0A223SBE2_9ACTN|nr:NmrA family NAD(P)-binding protein [Nocardiopsis gilva]ASU85484.1 NmrA family transcriptional regulator [Nocardiopsis gilva YIM 90087]
MTDRPIVVLGATGSTGRRVTGLLREAGHPVRAASRRGEVRFDWNDASTWDTAVDGAWGMYLMAPHELPIAPELVARAVDRGVRRIVLLSSRNIEAMGDDRLMAAERMVRGSGVEWTIVRPDWFNQNFDEGFFRPEIMAGQVVMPVGDVRQGFVDADDIAAVAAAALTGEGHAGRSYEVMGPRVLSFAEAVEIIGRESGRKVRFLGLAEDYRAAQAARGADRDVTEAEIAAFTALRDLGNVEPNGVVERVTGRPAKDFEVYAAEAAARGAWRD